MNEAEENLLTCEACNNTVKEDDDFCPECGALFIDEVYCDEHKDVPAEGVCIICSVPCCESCGARINDQFLCYQHDQYEIFEGMARVYGTPDDVTAQYVKSCLEQDGLHPVLFSRNSPYGIPGSKSSPFNVTGDYLKNIANAIKVMVPCQEVLRAEEILKSMDIVKR